MSWLRAAPPRGATPLDPLHSIPLGAAPLQQAFRLSPFTLAFRVALKGNSAGSLARACSLPRAALNGSSNPPARRPPAVWLYSNAAPPSSSCSRPPAQARCVAISSWLRLNVAEGSSRNERERRPGFRSRRRRRRRAGGWRPPLERASRAGQVVPPSDFGLAAECVARRESAAALTRCLEHEEKPPRPARNRGQTRSSPFAAERAPLPRVCASVCECVRASAR